jgi:hypothetical protein
MASMMKHVSDLGAAAYLMMHKYKIVGRKGKAFYFEASSAAECQEIDEKVREYLTTEFHRFDACIMSLKKMAEYMPEQD